MSFRGKEFTPEMVQLVVNVKKYFDSEKKAGPTAFTRNPAKRASEGLGIGLATVKRIMSRHRKQPEEAPAIIPSRTRGKPGYRLSVNLQPAVREFVREYNLKGQRVGVEKVRQYLSQIFQVEVPCATLWRTLKRWGFAHGTGQKRSTLKEREYVILARRNYVLSERIESVMAV
jgi:transposase